VFLSLKVRNEALTKPTGIEEERTEHSR